MNESTDSPTPPQGYVHYKGLFDDWQATPAKPEWLMLLWANLAALLPLAVGILLLWLPYQIYCLWGAPLSLLPILQLSTAWLVVVGLIINVFSMLVHEWLHGRVLLWCGYRPLYNFHKFWLLATVEPGCFLSRQHYLLVSLTPLVVMSTAGSIMLLFLPPVIGHLLLIALLLNCAASVGDLMVASRVYRAPDRALFSDVRGIQVFVPAQLKEQNALD